MVSVENFLATHFYKSTDNRRSASAPAVRVATLGIALGLAVMIITQGVVSGFQKEVSTKITGMASHIEVMDVRSLGSPENFAIDATPQFLSQIKASPNVTHTQLIATKMGILKTNDDFLAIQLKGIGPDYDSTYIRSALIEGHLPHSNEILISRTQAQTLKLKTGDRVFAYFFEEDIHTRRFTVCGIYDTHMEFFDRTTIFAPFADVAALNPWGEERPHACCCIEVKLRSLDDVPATQPLLANITATHTGGRAQAVSVAEHYPGKFAWLNLLNINMALILILMVCVAGITMIGGLLILILERTQTIGILKALGATNKQVRHTFMHFALMIIVRGMLIGNVIALALIFAQQQWGLVRLNPDIYYVDTVPVGLNLWPIIAINIATLAITMLALIVPSHIITRIQPAKAIRFE